MEASKASAAEADATTDVALEFEDIDGLRFVHDAGDDEWPQIFYEVIRDETYKHPDIPYQRAKIVVDVGAHIGLFARWIVQTVPAIHKIICIEPSRNSHHLLQLNTAHLREKVDVVRAAVCSQSGVHSLYFVPDAPGESTLVPNRREQQQLVLRRAAQAFVEQVDQPQELREAVSQHLQRDSASHGQYESSGEEKRKIAAAHDQHVAATEPAEFADTKREDVQGVTLDDVISRHVPSDSVIDVLKIDCEGVEEDVLTSISDGLWSRIQSVVLELEDFGGALDRCLHLLRERSFQVESHPNATRLSKDQGYFFFVPKELNLYYVFAWRASS